MTFLWNGIVKGNFLVLYKKDENVNSSTWWERDNPQWELCTRRFNVLKGVRFSIIDLMWEEYQ